MAELQAGQWELDGLLLGADTDYVVRSFEDGGRPAVRTQRASYADADGSRPGEDWHDGVSCSFDVLVETDPFGPSDAAVQAMVAVWRGDRVRTVAGGVQVLRQRRPGGATRRLYGRGGACTPVRSKGSGVGLVPVVARFEGTVDRWFADTPTVAELSIVPASTGGIVTTPGGGIVAPITTAAAGVRPGVLSLDGDLDTWPVLEITGPVSGASVELLVDGGRRWIVTFGASIPAGVTVTVDPRPWARTVLDQDGGNWSGRRTRASTRLPDMTVPPGQSTVVFRGTSVSGTASCRVTVEAAYAGP